LEALCSVASRSRSPGGKYDRAAAVPPASTARIERPVGQRLPRVTLPDFDYQQPAPFKGQPDMARQHGSGTKRSQPHRRR